MSGEHYKADSGHGGSSDLNRINNTTSTATGRVRVKSDIHLAHHEGYEISRPITFFEHYGPYALAILRILKHTWTIPSVVTPETQGSLDDVVRRVEAVDMSIGFLEQKLDDTKALDEKGDREDRKEERVFERLVALEGADLRRLETFLRNKDKDKILGNLYRITTEVGHVKWVCRDHYRQGYCNTASSSPLQSSEANGANYDPLIDDVTVELKLRTAPRDFLSRVSSRASTIMSSRSI
ncbi:hypothetical protein BGZ95_001322 [Linnemannia exigua]|uniref:Uncharacterized protein n=1 Tax=Linnemannia exigua TaxID=604196 RepID=A0AAD4D7E4_9FUNG|nr:hypothetical protein BGZ95_001322 [Linnemannia exigua]